MPAKYSHVKKKSASGLLRKAPGTAPHSVKEHRSRSTNPLIDRTLSHAMSAVSQLERAIARIILIRYEHDIARLFSTRLHKISLMHLPTFMMRCIAFAGPAWVAFNADCDPIKDFFRAAISMDMRQAGERVATKSVLWSYTALRHFAMSNNVPICPDRGLQSLRLLPYYPALKAHLDVLESMPHPSFAKPPHLSPLTGALTALETACELFYAHLGGTSDSDDDAAAGGASASGSTTTSRTAGIPPAWRAPLRIGYERLTQTLWRVAREFSVRGYGLVLREKLTAKWCDCGCSTDHLGEVCERTVRSEERGVRPGKQREWDGRGSGVFGWETEEEEDVWEVELDWSGDREDEGDPGGGEDADVRFIDLVEQRYIKAEREKEFGNAAFRKGEYETAVRHYERAHEIEPELPHYQLNLAAAHLKLRNWMRAEEACTKALSQHRSEKGHYRRAKARKMLGRTDEAIKDLRAVLKIQPVNAEALAELTELMALGSGSGTVNSTCCLPSSSSSSSGQQPHTHAHTQNHNHQHNQTQHTQDLPIPQPKPARALPFARTKADDLRLKIAPVPEREGKKADDTVAYPYPYPYTSWDRYVLLRAE